MLVAQEVAIQLISVIRPIVPIIAKQDRDLADQLRRAASSVVLNLAEGNESAKGNRQKHFAIAHGSASEVRAALQTAVAWGWIEPVTAAPKVLDRLMSLLWGLTHPRADRCADQRADRCADPSRAARADQCADPSRAARADE